MDLFDYIIRVNAESSESAGVQYGIVADVNDPLNLQRVQVYDQAKGGKFKSDWLMRGLPYTGFSPPVPKLGDLVVFGYIGNDPHLGCYFGLIVNLENKPVGSDTDLTIALGGTEVAIKIDGSVKVRARGPVSIDSETEIALTAPSVTIAGKQVATVGATDSRGDTLVTKGW